MLRITPTVQKCLMPMGPNVIAVPNAKTTQVLPSLRGDTFPVVDIDPEIKEIASRSIYNDTNGKLVYVCLGGDCDNQVAWHLQLAAGQQLDCSNHAGSVSVYCPTGTTNIAVTVIINNDRGQYKSYNPGSDAI